LSFYNISLADYKENNTIYVDDDGGFDYENIQQAIDNAKIGDTIYVYNGTYYENVIIDKEIILNGEDKTNTFINNTNSVIQIISDNVFISGFTITNGLIGLKIENSSKCSIKSNTIINNNIGVNIDNLSDNNLIYNNNFIKNNVNAYDKGDNRWYKSNDGNYWDDFDESIEGAYDNDSNGIVDKPYNLIIGNNQDTYPLISAITDNPIADFTFSPLDPTTYMLIEFNDTSYDPDGYIKFWFWNFGNNYTSNNKNTTTEFINEGIYNITLEVTDNYGMVNKSNRQIRILNSKPITIFSYSPIEPNDIKYVTFYDESYDKDGGIVKWEWDFGDGTIILNPENPREISHKYDDNGTYNVTLTVYDNDKLSNSTTIEIIVENVKPTANFYYKPLNKENIMIIENEEVKFYDTSKDEDGEIVKYLWDFGYGIKSNLSNPIHVFEKGGSYNIILTVYDNDGESSTKQARITVLSRYESSGKSSWTGLSLIAIVIIIFILVLVGLSIILGRKP
jgi:PKD repeat protein